jgi:hypothetical protein
MLSISRLDSTARRQNHIAIIQLYGQCLPAGIMTKNLDAQLAQWIENMMGADPIAIDREIDNRVTPYPQLQSILSEQPIDVAAFFKQAKKCTVMIDLMTYTSSSITLFFEDKALAGRLITRLVGRLPRSPEDVPITLDATIDEAVNKGRLQQFHAVRLLSLVLTAAHPDKFVDYPANIRWESFAQRLNYGLPVEKTPGARIMWASDLAMKLSEQKTFQQHWPSEENRYQHPLWIASALCWANKTLEEKAD